jgi:ATP-dependent Clp protease ATP-binding subunit ClpC
MQKVKEYREIMKKRGIKGVKVSKEFFEYEFNFDFDYHYNYDDTDLECYDDIFTPAEQKELAELQQQSDEFRFQFAKQLGDIFNKKMEELPVPTPTLNEFTLNLSKQAVDGKLDPVIGREKEVERVVQILSRRRKNNPILIGEPGVGKTAVAEALALRIHNQQVASCLAKKEVAILDVGSLVAGTKYRGEFEERLKRIMSEVKAKKNLILVIDEVHTIVGAGAAEGSLDAANILKPALARGELQCIGATTIEEFKKIEKDPALERRFQPVIILEPSKDECLRILKGLRGTYERFHNVRLPNSTLKISIDMSSLYIKDRFLPDKAIDLVDEACSKVKIENLLTNYGFATSLENDLIRVLEDKDFAIRSQDFERASKLRDKEMVIRTQIKGFLKRSNAPDEVVDNQDTLPIVGSEEVSSILSSWTGIPLNKIGKDESKKLLNIEKEMHTRIIGQHRAVTAICDAIKRSRVNVRSKKQPIASFLFCGPTGVGKTEVTKTLANVFFGSETAMIRFDMSEFMERHTVAKLIGSPPGYIGYNEGGQLTEAVRRKPFSLILFDEVEKAHPDIFNLLLQVLDDGRLTDAKGKTIDFTNTIIIMTSNLGSQYIETALNKEKKDEKEENYSVSLGSTIEVEEEDTKNKFLENVKIKLQNERKDSSKKLKEVPLEYQSLEEDLVGLSFSKLLSERDKKKQYDEEYEKIKELVNNEIKNFFRPEFINRIDDIVIFDKLRKEEVAEICTIMLKDLSNQMREDNAFLFVEDNAKKFVVDEGYNPVYGARPLRRSISQHIQSKIANATLETPLLTLKRLVMIKYDEVRKTRAIVYPLPSFVLSPFDKSIINCPENDSAVHYFIKTLKKLINDGVNIRKALSGYYDNDDFYLQETEEKEEIKVLSAKKQFVESLDKIKIEDETTDNLEENNIKNFEEIKDLIEVKEDFETKINTKNDKQIDEEASSDNLV